MEKNKKGNELLLAIGIVIVILIVLLIIELKNIKPIQINNEKVFNEKYTISASIDNNSFAQTNAITVTIDNGDEYEYSFDGGYTWSNISTYEAIQNGTLSIKVRDTDGNVYNLQNYEITNIDNTAPVIESNLPEKIIVGETLKTSDYFTAKDDKSGVKTLTFSSETINTKKEGTTQITVTAIDSAGNSTTISYPISIEKNNTSSKTTTTYYRYRTKTTTTYNCNPYDCSTVSIKETISQVVDTGKCTKDYQSCKEQLPTTCTEPCSADGVCRCGQAFTNRFRNDSNGLTVDGVALKSDGTSVACNESRSNITYKKAPCGENEVEMNGYCHAKCNKVENDGCESGYTRYGNACTANQILKEERDTTCIALYQPVCAKKVQKTCYEKCTKSTWSSWSSWQKTKVKESATVEVETKEE